MQIGRVPSNNTFINIYASSTLYNIPSVDVAERFPSNKPTIKVTSLHIQFIGTRLWGLRDPTRWNQHSAHQKALVAMLQIYVAGSGYDARISLNVHFTYSEPF